MTEMGGNFSFLWPLADAVLLLSSVSKTLRSRKLCFFPFLAVISEITELAYLYFLA